MSAIVEYKSRMDELFREWKEIKNIEINRKKVQRVSFNEDGIINPHAWFLLPPNKRILFILKETHDDNRENWSLTNLLNIENIKNESNYRIWRRAAEWTKGIISTSANHPVEPYRHLEGEDSGRQIQNIAILNLKKSPGGSVAKQDEIEAYAKADIDMIEREIEIIDPSIILFGGTFWYFQKAYSKKKFQMHHDLRFSFGTLAGKERILIDYWHPANHYPAVTSYYGIVGIYQAALKKKESMSS